MGHGCYYTNNETKSRAFWIDLSYYYEDEETKEDTYDAFLWDDTISNLKYELESIGYTQKDEYNFYNGLFNLVLESGYGGEVVFRLEPLNINCYYSEDVRIYNLALGNHSKCYNKLAKELVKVGYKLRIATSGYTSTDYLPN